MLKNPREKKYHHETVQEVLYERRLLIFITWVAGLGMLTWLVAVSTDYWIIEINQNATVILNNGTEDIGKLFLWRHSGLWRRCSIYLTDNGEISECQYHDLNESSPVAGFMRAELAVCLMTILLIGMAAGFSIYSLIHPRYTFKRLSGALHLITALSIISLLEMVKTDTHRLSHDQFIHQEHMVVLSLFGYSYLLGCIVLVIFIIACVAFFVGSRKRKTLPHDFETALS